jgi:hypothetical protein
MGWPVWALIAYTYDPCAVKFRVSSPLDQYVTPRLGPRPSIPESNVHRTAPVAASSATTRCFGVVVNSTPSTTIGLV